MGVPHPASPVKLICGILAAGEAALAEAVSRLEQEFGPRDVESAVVPFDFTPYYEKEMGSRLLRKFVAFAGLVAPDRLAAVKLRTNALEQSIAARATGGPARPVNLDPGYVCAGKLVLATTKDQGHRVYLGGGIYAEVTLNWRKGTFTPNEWTYPDYRTEPYRAFFDEVRRVYRKQIPPTPPAP